MLQLSTSTLWYLTRSSGLVLLVVLTACLVLGILVSAGWAPTSGPRFLVSGLHRNLTWLAALLLVTHVLTAELDPFAPLGWLAAVVPFLTPYRALWLGLGTLSADLVLAVALSSLLRPRLGFRGWKAIHWLAYLSWPTALLHSLGTGTDTRLTWFFVVEVLCLVTVVAALIWRLAHAPTAPHALKLAAAVALVAFPVAVMVWAGVGPLRPGWARSAGTPRSLLASSTTTSAAAPTASGPIS